MYKISPSPFIISSVLLSILLQACAESPTYAPVTTSSQILSKDEQDKTDHGDTNKPKVGKPSINNTEPRSYSPAPKRKTEQPVPEKNADSSTVPTEISAKAIATHTVKKSETLFSIAKQHGMDFRQLALWNKLPQPYNLAIGQKVKLSALHAEKSTPNKITKYQEISHKILHNDKKYSITAAKPKQSSISYKPTHTKHTVTAMKSDKLKIATISNDKQKMLKLAFEWPIKGVVVKSFQQSKNKGIDIAGKLGQSVFAAEAGKVIYGGAWLVGFGNLLIIKHNPIYLTAYANNSQLLVKEGQKVQKGQMVAQVGRTPSRQAALHFEIRKYGKSVNPLRFLPSL